jgi:hypothetical protein
VAFSEYLRPRDEQHRARRVLVIVLAIAALTCSVATRTFRLTDSHGINARSADAQAMRQHLDRDASKWTSPAPVHTTLVVLTFYPRIAPAGPPMPSVLFDDEHLYNRPPPSC